jgi:hypothetical protein
MRRVVACHGLFDQLLRRGNDIVLIFSRVYHFYPLFFWLYPRESRGRLDEELISQTWRPLSTSSAYSQIRMPPPRPDHLQLLTSACLSRQVHARPLTCLELDATMMPAISTLKAVLLLSVLASVVLGTTIVGEVDKQAAVLVSIILYTDGSLCSDAQLWHACNSEVCSSRSPFVFVGCRYLSMRARKAARVVEEAAGGDTVAYHATGICMAVPLWTCLELWYVSFNMTCPPSSNSQFRSSGDILHKLVSDARASTALQVTHRALGTFTAYPTSSSHLYQRRSTPTPSIR